MMSTYRTNQKVFLCRPIALCVAFAVLLIFSVAAGVVRPVSAQSPHEQIMPSLVYLKAEGRGRSDTQDKATYGTGFLVSQDGLVLTTYHLITELGDVEPSTVRFWASVKRKSDPMERITAVDAATTTDLLLLKMPPVDKFAPVKIGRALDHKDTEPLYTSGFPKSAPGPTAVNGQGYVKQRDGQGSYTWTTDIAVEYGQSGSPIYNAAGEVIGVAKGDNNATLAYFIPIEFASTLLAQVHFRAIQKAFEDYEVLRRKLEWSGSFKENAGLTLILLQYEKFVAGKPDVETIDILVEAGGYKGNNFKKMESFPLRNRAPAGRNGETGRVFEVADLWPQVESLRKILGYEVIISLDITIIAKMSDGTEQLPKRIWIDMRR